MTRARIVEAIEVLAFLAILAGIVIAGSAVDCARELC